MKRILKQVQDNMAKIKSAVFCFLLIFNLYGCQKKNTESSFQTNEPMNINTIEQIFEKQIKNGANQYIKEAGVAIPSQFAKEDIEAEVTVINNLLKTSGYKFPTDEEFKAKIENIFGRKIISNSTNKYLYIDYLDKCSHEYLNYRSNGTDYFGTYIIKNNNFITDFLFLPEIVDYQKAYPKLVNIEKNVVTEKKDFDGNSIIIEKWIELEENSDRNYNLKQRRQKNTETVVSRNKYLFNDSKADFVWLKFNDTAFLESLVKTFGYVKNEELLKFVLEKNYKKTDDLRKILWNKRCDGKIVFNKEVIDIIKKLPAEQQKEYLFRISEYIAEEIKNGNDAFKNNFSKKAEILGKLSYYGEKIGEEIGMPYQCFKILGTDEGGKKYEEEFEKQKYYNISDFKSVWEETKTGGVGLPGMDGAFLEKKEEKQQQLLNLYDRPDFSSFSREVLAKGDVEVLHQTSGWDFIKVDGTTGYLPTEEAQKEKEETQKRKYNFLADEEDIKPEKKKGFWDNLFS